MKADLHLRLLLITSRLIASVSALPSFIIPTPPLRHGKSRPSARLGAQQSRLHSLRPSSFTQPRSVYVHIPFCRRRCYYCDFPISVVGDSARAQQQQAESYYGVLKREMEATASTWCPPSSADSGGQRVMAEPSIVMDSVWRDEWERAEASGERGVSTVFFGGGTPSLMPPEVIGRIVDDIERLFGPLSAGCEISMEMDPGSFDQDKLRSFLTHGRVNRVSLGVQSFSDKTLQRIGRAHSARDVYRAIEDLRACGVDNWSVDLIGGLPELTVDEWEGTVREAIDVGAPHLSVYDLQVEEGSFFGRWGYQAGESPLPTEDASAQMYRSASRLLRDAGYVHYEVSNYAKEGHQCRHNMAYWENVPFFAFGNGAASFTSLYRFSRPRRLQDYRVWVDRLEREGFLHAAGFHSLAELWDESIHRYEKTHEGTHVDDGQHAQMYSELRRECLSDGLMLGLRLKSGISLSRIAKAHGTDAVNGILRAIDQSSAIERGLVRVFCRPRCDSDSGDEKDLTSGGDALRVMGEGGREVGVCLTDPEGFLLSNDVISSMFACIDQMGWGQLRTTQPAL
ncbi:unnamed protein product [Vitrella brassicaformis CCMP3155]|uniref:Radical S-adenosyl methionine domain-containing protein 1, mitochondrial n=3 Tax=Vitrella brassicaformis TaxID=1169539 RepID=A0A0G4H4P5_VITBC|nr:unnamed protein product [Vitrella brassicaformis CCMP3155]|mmetsp:Transcript_9713/g.28015  ORF Transcript_9713/g.28015 Transcript_9713/m.28015 type:complete len:567 (-) Transcript_9713:27-1727(-)|eukprot:CEM38763.1 unnamed protein product [Vitrella brassicaformis CCMP3155]